MLSTRGIATLRSIWIARYRNGIPERPNGLAATACVYAAPRRLPNAMRFRDHMRSGKIG